MKHNEDPSGESEQCQHSPLPVDSHQVRLCTENKARCPSDAVESPFLVSAKNNHKDADNSTACHHPLCLIELHHVVKLEIKCFIMFYCKILDLKPIKSKWKEE